MGGGAQGDRTPILFQNFLGRTTNLMTFMVPTYSTGYREIEPCYIFYFTLCPNNYFPI